MANGSTQFAVFYLLYPMLQGNLIISAINYTWHAFVHEGDEQNRHFDSTGRINDVAVSL